MRKLAIGLMTCAGLAAPALLSGAAVADPLGGKEPWNFTPQNRGALAIAIKNVEDGKGAGGDGTGGGTTIVCGGTSGASGDGATGTAAKAQANSTCVIVNNSDGAIVDVDQTSVGNQSAEAETETSNSSGPSGSIDEVAAVLAGRGN